MEQNNITSDDEGLFKDVVNIEATKAEKSNLDEVQALINQQRNWELNDARILYSGIVTEFPDDEQENIRQKTKRDLLAWLADKPQRIYIWQDFEQLLDLSTFAITMLKECLEAFYNAGGYQEMVDELMKYEDRATEIPLIMVIDGQEEERIVYGEIRQVQFTSLNKKKSVIVLVINKSKFMEMEQD